MDKNKIHIDDWIRDSLSHEVDNEGIHQSWNKMSAMLDDNDRKGRGAFWYGKGGIILFLSLAIMGTVAGFTFLGGHADNSTQIASNKPSHSTAPITSQTQSSQPQSSTQVQQPTSSTVISSPTPVVSGRVDAQSMASTSNPQQKSRKSTSSNSVQTQSHQGLAHNTPHSNTQEQTTWTDPNTNTDKSTPVILVSNSNDIHKYKDKTNIDSLKSVLLQEVKDKKIVYSDKNNTVNRIKETPVKEIHQIVEYPHIKNNDNTPVTTTTAVHTYTKVDLIPLTQLEELILSAFTLNIIENVASEAEYNYLEVVEKDMVATSYKINATAGNNKNKEQSISLLKDINNFFNVRKNFYTTAIMGFNTTPNNWLPLGFQAGLGFHYYISDRFTIGVEGLYNFRNSNFEISDVQNTYTVLGLGSSGGSTYFNYEDHSIDREYKVKYLQSFQFPIMFNYHTPKMTLGMGPVIGFSSPIKYHKFDKENVVERTLVADTSETFPLSSSSFRYAESNFGKNMLLGFNASVNLQINPQASLNLRYNQFFWDNGKNNNVHNIMSKTFKQPEIRIGLQYKLSKSKRVQYMMPTGS